MQINFKMKQVLGRGFISVAPCLSHKLEVLHLIPGIEKKKKKTISKRMDIINQAVYTAIKHDLEAMPKREMPCNRMTELFIII